MSRSRAAERKARQRARQKAGGMVPVTIDLPKALADALAAAGRLTGTSVKTQAEAILALTAPRNHRDLASLAGRAAKIWREIAPTLNFTAYLAKPGAKFRIGDRIYAHEAWAPLFAEYSEIVGLLERRGWKRHQIENFMRHAETRVAAEIKARESVPA